MGKGMYGDCFRKVIILHFKKYLFIIFIFYNSLFFCIISQAKTLFM